MSRAPAAAPVVSEPAPPLPIERLSFADGEAHQAIEACVHLARYLVARPFCNGRRVLDAACGEGYGSRFLRLWGASRVEGVDASAEAVGRANALFGGDQVLFRCDDVQALERLYAPGFFDLAVCLETMEHVEDAARLLAGLRHAVGPDGAIIVSCPNDHRFYAPDQRNPFHVRKYTFAQFQTVTEDVLGKASGWLLGTPLLGIGTFPAPLWAHPGGTRMRLFDSADALASLAVPPDEAVSEANCSYFVGLWGCPPPPGISACFFPSPVDAVPAARYQARAEALRDQARDAVERAQASEARAASLERELARLRLLGEAVAKENELLRQELGAAREALLSRVAARLGKAAAKSLLPRPVRAALNRILGRDGAR